MEFAAGAIRPSRNMFSKVNGEFLSPSRIKFLRKYFLRAPLNFFYVFAEVEEKISNHCFLANKLIFWTTGDLCERVLT